MLHREEWRASDSQNQQLLLLWDFEKSQCAATLSAAIVNGIAMNGYQNNVICTTERSMLSQQSKIPKIEWKGEEHFGLCRFAAGGR
jgi:hypothetical protein